MQNMTIHMIESFHANKEETYIRPPLQLQIFFGILFFVVETLGNFLLFCLIIYEKYGMDAQKRTATNQLLSGFCCSVILFNVGILPLIMTVNIFVPQSESNIFKNKRWGHLLFHLKLQSSKRNLQQSNFTSNIEYTPNPAIHDFY